MFFPNFFIFGVHNIPKFKILSLEVTIGVFSFNFFEVTATGLEPRTT